MQVDFGNGWIAIVAFCVLHVAQLPNMLVAQHAVQTSLAEAWWARVHDLPETSEERLFATSNLASSLYAAGKYVESERVEQELLLLKKRSSCVTKKWRVPERCVDGNQWLSLQRGLVKRARTLRVA